MTEETEEEEEYLPASPVQLCVGDVYILDPEYLSRDSDIPGVIAVRVTEDQDVEYLDGESRIWMRADVPKGPQRH